MVIIDDGGARVVYFPEFINKQFGKELFEELFCSNWRQDFIKIYGRVHPVPRLQQWYGDPDKAYTWSGIKMNPLPWTPSLLKVRCLVQDALGTEFNSVLLNMYRHGRDTVSWHSDDELELGEHPTIASISLGATRDFQLRKKIGLPTKIQVQLEDCSLLVMSGETQKKWEHSIPRRMRLKGPRINLTFRKIINEA
jgi:alkylated DNA repair dioxygenase AlkB